MASEPRDTSQAEAERNAEKIDFRLLFESGQSLQLILTPMILKLMDGRRRALGAHPQRVPA